MPKPIYTEDEVRIPMGAHSRAGQCQSNPLDAVMEDATSALGYSDYQRGDNEIIRMPKAAVASGGIDLTRAFTMADGYESFYRLNLVPAGKTNDLNPEALMRENSRVVAAGARLIVAPEKPAPSYGLESGANHPGFYTNPSKVRHVEPASFASVTDGQEAALSPIPFADADFSWPNAPNFAFRSKITRAQSRDVGGDQLGDDFMIAIALGLGELADHLFLSAVLAATPAAFTLGALATRHAKLDEARALVGTLGNSASSFSETCWRPFRTRRPISGQRPDVRALCKNVRRGTRARREFKRVGRVAS